MNWRLAGLHHAAIMAWETFWASAFGFAISAALQVFVSKEQMSRLFGSASFKSVAMATGLGAASSSCSYAAAAAARSAFRQGAALVPTLAFMFASTNLVIELGAVLWLLMGWRFVLAEVVGAFVLITLMRGLMKLLFPQGLEEEARKHVEAQDDEGDHCHHHSTDDDGPEHASDADHGASQARWKELADTFVMDWQMLWKEIAVGFLIAGFLMALVPVEEWRMVFLEGGPAWLRQVENAFVGPLFTVGSFVCSVGNIPLASILWRDGTSFGGVMSFIYADLLIILLILIYRKYYGAKTAAYITIVFYLAMVGAGLSVNALFNLLSLVPQGARPPSVVEQARFRWNYTSWLDMAALMLVAALWWLHARNESGAVRDDDQAESAAHAHHH